MNKDYSDLSDRQKLIYIKRGVVLTCCTILPFILFVGVFLAMPNSDFITSEPSDAVKIGAAMIFLFTVWGMMLIGLALGYYLVEKMNLYTEINLDKAEKRVKRIKESMKE